MYLFCFFLLLTLAFSLLLRHNLLKCHPDVFDAIARIAIMLLRNHFNVKTERKKQKVVVGWRSDKTLMITRVRRMDTEPLIQLRVCS